MYKRLIIALFLTSFSLLAEPLTLSRDGQVTVVTAKDAPQSVQFAAEELATALKQTLNVTALRKNDDAPRSDQEITFLVGMADQEKTPQMAYDSFRMERQGNCIMLYGGDDDKAPLENYFQARTGTLYAVYAFLYRELGVRMLWPGESGTIYPKLDKISIDQLAISDAPALPIRNSYYGSGRTHGEASLKNLVRFGRFNGMGSTKIGSVGHASSKAIGTGYFTTHPEYYALINGKRNQPIGDRWKLCHSNPDLPGLFAEWGLKSGDDFFSVSANDSTGWCECAECRKLDDGQKSLYHNELCVSGRMFTLANRTAQLAKAAGSPKDVAIYAYGAYLDPPASIPRLEDNIMLFVAHGISWNAAPQEAAKFQQLFDAWSKKTDNLVLRDYRNNTCPMVVFPYPKLAHRYIQDLNKRFRNFQGIDICGDDTRATALWGPTGYVYARLLWDPTLELEPILDDFYRHGWPQSHPIMRRYFEYFEEHSANVIAQSGANFWPWRADNELLTARKIMSPEAFKKGYAMLDEAQKATSDPAELARIAFVRTGLDASKIDQEYYDALMHVAAFSGALNNIPAHPEKDAAANPKTLLQKAGEAIRRRQDFLAKNRNHEGIPAAPLGYPKARFTSDWEATIAYLTEIHAQKPDSSLLLTDNWRFQIDPANQGTEQKWFDPQFDDGKWTTIHTNGPWETQGFGAELFPETKGYNGLGWYRRSFEVPEAWQGGRFLLTLGAVDESFQLYLDGQLRHSFTYDAAVDPDAWQKPHVIDLSPYLTPGQHQLTVAVNDRGGTGGIWKPSYLQWERPNLLPEDLSKFEATNLKITGRKLELTQGESGTLAIAVKTGAGSYSVKMEYQDQSQNYFYKLPIAIKISFKDASGKTLEEQVSGSIHRNNLKPGTWQNFELNFEAPPTTARISLRLLLRLNQIELKSFQLEK